MSIPTFANHFSQQDGSKLEIPGIIFHWSGGVVQQRAGSIASERFKYSVFIPEAKQG